jgi:hypothetical protein
VERLTPLGCTISTQRMCWRAPCFNLGFSV